MLPTLNIVRKRVDGYAVPGRRLRDIRRNPVAEIPRGMTALPYADDRRQSST